MKTLFIKKKEVYLKVERYQNKTIYLQLYELDGEPWTTITLNPDIALPYGIAAIKNYSENEGMLKWRGIPVKFAGISRFCAIVEMDYRASGYAPELSYGET